MKKKCRTVIDKKAVPTVVHGGAARHESAWSSSTRECEDRRSRPTRGRMQRGKLGTLTKKLFREQPQHPTVDIPVSSDLFHLAANCACVCLCQLSRCLSLVTEATGGTCRRVAELLVSLAASLHVWCGHSREDCSEVLSRMFHTVAIADTEAPSCLRHPTSTTTTSPASEAAEIASLHPVTLFEETVLKNHTTYFNCMYDLLSTKCGT